VQALNVTLVQADIEWCNPALNRQRFAQRLAGLQGKTDLVVLPEMFSTGYQMEPERSAESANGPTLAWMLEQARYLHAAMVGSVAVASDGHFVNRFYWVQPDGVVYVYDKRHLFRMAGEHHHYAPGDQPLVVTWRGWRVCPMICYDLRFPVWSRRRPDCDYDVLMYVASWPSARRHVWQTLLAARAIENLSYCIGVNRVGTDGNQLHYSGDSMAIGFTGETLVTAGSDDGIVSVTLDGEALVRFRQQFPAHLDADEFSLA
jgi:omega-amidase